MPLSMSTINLVFVNPFRWCALCLGAILCGVASGLVAPAVAQSGEIVIDFQMLHDPELERPGSTKRFAERLASLWVEALERPEADLQRRVGEMIVRAHQMEVPGLDIAIPRLRELLIDEKTHPAARSAAAKALAALSARTAAPDLAHAAGQFPGDVRQVCERALGEWQYEPIRAEWLERLHSNTVRHRDLVLAIQGLGMGEVKEATDRLLALLFTHSAASEVRVEAAQALGRIHGAGMVSDARKLLEGPHGGTLVNRLAAARLLARHQLPEAHEILLKLAVDEEPAVRAEALRLLNGIDSSLVLPLAEEAMQHPDHLVRWQGMIAYTRLATPERMAPVASLLNDLIPDLRRDVCSRLDDLLARPELVPAIWSGVETVLSRDGWRGQEQAGLLIGKHIYKPAVNRLLELQSIPRAEARVTAAWALRRLAIPETREAIFKLTESLTAQRLGGLGADQIDEQVAHLFEALALMQHWQAEALWRQYVPKNPPMGHFSRATAVWALGLRFRGEPQPQLAAQLIERLTDTAPLPPELEFVRYACAITLGRIQGKEHVSRMVQWVGEESLRAGKVSGLHALAVRWAVEQLTGEKYPDLKPVTSGRGGWFLEPIDLE